MLLKTLSSFTKLKNKILNPVSSFFQLAGNCEVLLQKANSNKQDLGPHFEKIINAQNLHLIQLNRLAMK